MRRRGHHPAHEFPVSSSAAAGQRGYQRSRPRFVSRESAAVERRKRTGPGGCVRSRQPKLKPGAKVVTINSFDLFSHSNYQDLGRYQEVDLSVGADAEETLPALIEEVKRQITANRRAAFQARGAKLAAAHQRTEAQARTQAAFGWNESPISTARIAAELWAQIKDKDWSLISRSDSMASWPQRLWSFEKFYHHIGQSGSVGVGYSAPAAVGAALANKKYGRLSH